MAVLVALGTVLATFLGGFLALRARKRMHLVLGLSAGLLLGLVSFDLIPEVFELSSLEFGHVPAVMVMFVVGFLAMIALRTSGVIPESWLSPLKTIEQWCLAVALVGLGSEVRISKLFNVGGKPLLLAAISWGSIAVMSLLGVRFIA